MKKQLPGYEIFKECIEKEYYSVKKITSFDLFNLTLLTEAMFISLVSFVFMFINYHEFTQELFWANLVLIFVALIVNFFTDGKKRAIEKIDLDNLKEKIGNSLDEFDFKSILLYQNTKSKFMSGTVSNIVLSFIFFWLGLLASFALQVRQWIFTYSSLIFMAFIIYEVIKYFVIDYKKCIRKKYIDYMVHVCALEENVKKKEVKNMKKRFKDFISNIEQVFLFLSLFICFVCFILSLKIRNNFIVFTIITCLFYAFFAGGVIELLIIKFKENSKEKKCILAILFFAILLVFICSTAPEVMVYYASVKEDPEKIIESRVVIFVDFLIPIASALIGGGCTVYGVVRTIEENRRVEKEKRIDECKPLFTTAYESGGQVRKLVFIDERCNKIKHTVKTIGSLVNSDKCAFVIESMTIDDDDEELKVENDGIIVKNQKFSFAIQINGKGKISFIYLKIRSLANEYYNYKLTIDKTGSFIQAIEFEENKNGK